jgi:uncharacterized damage-inducible protein DinB
MNYQTIEEIFAANDRIRERLLETVREISDEQAAALPDGEKWTIAEIVEHISIVADGMAKISAKLLKEAQAAAGRSNGAALISENFSQKLAASADVKLEAPEMVRPTGKQTIAESLEKLEESRQRLYQLRPLFETVDCSGRSFKHPFFGDLTAHEWLALVGGHEFRHLQQIKKRLGKGVGGVDSVNS